MRAKASINFGLVDVTAKSDSIPTANDKKTFVDMNDLKRDNLEEVKYATLEKNQFALDGTFKVFPENDSTLDDMGWWSNSMSDSTGNFTTPLVMEVDFTEPHTSLGVTLKFSEAGDYCNHLKLAFYDASNNLISETDFYPDNYSYFCKKATEDYQKIVITFYSTNNPYRYLKLYKILYGAEIVFENDSLIEAKVLEEVDLLSSEVRINTLDFTCYSEDDDFNILNPQGAYASLQERQKFDVRETMTKEGTTKKIGSFYLDTWSSEADKQMKFGAIDLIGVIDKTQFNGGMYYNTTFEDIVTSIFESANLTIYDYEIQEDLKNISMTGYIPICTHREALQQVLFSVGAVADCSRSDKIKIYTTSQETTELNLIEKDNIFQGSKKIEQNELVTGVSIVAHNYVVGTEQEELFNDTLNAGRSTITFSEPVANLTITGGTIVESNCNYAIVSTPTTGTIVINGYKYIDNTQVYTVEVPDLNPRKKQNTLKIEEAYFITKANATTIAQNVLNYYQKTYKTTFNFIVGDEILTQSVEMEEDFEQRLVGQITKLDLDLTGGFTATGEVNATVTEANNG